MYGPSKFGKTEICSHLPNALFIATEPGHNAIDGYIADVHNYQELLAVSREFVVGEHEFETVILDTLDAAHMFCAAHICKVRGVEHEGDLQFNKGYSLVRQEFYRYLLGMAKSKYTVIFIAHCKEREFKMSNGATQLKYSLALSGSVSEAVLGLADCILYCDYAKIQGKNGLQRVIRSRNTRRYDAGDRFGIVPDPCLFEKDTFLKLFEENTQM